MKKTFKIIGIVFASLISLIIIAASIACYFIFTPEKLTPIVRDQAKNFLTCDTQLESVNLTFFSTFPNFALEIEQLTLADSINTTDTIAHIDRLTAEVNLTQFLFKGNLIINGIELKNASANIQVDSLGNANYNILNLPETEEKEDTTTSILFDILKIETIDVVNFNAEYTDENTKIHAIAENLNAHINGFYKNKDADANMDLTVEKIFYAMTDSSEIISEIRDSKIEADLTIRDHEFSGQFGSKSTSVNLAINGDTLANDVLFDLNIPATWDNNLSLLKLGDSQLEIGGIKFGIDGYAQLKEDESVFVDGNINAKELAFNDILALIPNSYAEFLNDFKTLDGNITVNANAKGEYNDSTMPLVDVSMLIADVVVNHKMLPDYRFDQTTADMHVSLNLNEEEKSVATINKLFTRTGTTSLEASGEVSDFMNKILMDLSLTVDVNLPEVYPLIKELPIKISGRSALNVNMNTSMEDIKSKNLKNIIASGTISYKDLDILYNDSIHITDKKGYMNMSIPSNVTNKQFDPALSLEIKGTDIYFDMLGEINAILEAPHLNVTLSNPFDKTKMIGAAAHFDMEDLDFKMDTIAAKITHPIGYASLSPSKLDKTKPLLTVAYKSDSISASVGRVLDFRSDKIDVKAFSRYDKSGKNAFLQWNPVLDVDFNNGFLSMANFPSDIQIPSIKFNFNPRSCKIEKSRIVIDDSDFNLYGDITNIRPFVEGSDLLIGKMNFVSDNTNIDQLMDLVNGLGCGDSADNSYAENVDVTKDDIKEEDAELPDSITNEVQPFMVPKGVDIILNTNIKNAVFNKKDIENVKGKLTVNDGRVILEQMGFTSEAAEMQITGMYRSDRENHLFAGLDFHLLDIDIKSLIELIPDIDSIVPMLASFEGSGEFHMIAETYLKSDYSPKMSTLRAAAAFEGKDLVVLDGEMFSTIAKYMMFNKKTRNVVDSLAVEMTVYRNEIDVYPFLISMDKWQAVLSGRHNLDMSFNYHISLTDCPLPVRLGLDIKGTFDDMKYDLVPCKYKALYKPGKEKNEMQQRTLHLKKIISDALKENVKR